jgi:murein DD-endopeptidase MepM/ murein hydrolase activator NlpD
MRPAWDVISVVRGDRSAAAPDARSTSRSPMRASNRVALHRRKVPPAVRRAKSIQKHRIAWGSLRESASSREPPSHVARFRDRIAGIPRASLSTCGPPTSRARFADRQVDPMVVILTLLLLVMPGAPPTGPVPLVRRPVPQHWVWPLQPRPTVLRGFFPPAQRWSVGHLGVDLAALPGQAVRAAGDGVVSYAGPLAGRGVVAIVHGELRTTYEPVVPSVTVGARVRAGSVIGSVASPSGHCGASSCLHWGLLRGTEYLNPVLLVRGPSRLLPLGTPGLVSRRKAP